MTLPIDLPAASVLITGGSEGIGLGLAARFLGAGSSVLITGRSPEKLQRAQQRYPGIRTFANDVGIPAEREELAAYIRRDHPHLNVVINNAGIQRRVSLAADAAPWAESQREIDILLGGPIRFALAGTSCRVVEVIPPAVRSALAGPGATHGAPLDDFCDSTFAALSQGNTDEIGYGVTATDAFNAPKSLYQAMFEQLAGRFPIKTYLSPTG